MNRFALALVLQLAALAIAILIGQGLYVVVIVPRLSSLQSVPLHWWLLVYGPPLAVCGWVGWHSRSYIASLLFGTLAAVVQSAIDYLLWYAKEPGHLKEPADFIVIPLVFWAAVFVVTACTARLMRRMRPAKVV